MPAGTEVPEQRKSATHNISPPMWDSSDPLRRPAPLPQNTNPELHAIDVRGSSSPTKGSPTKSFTPASVRERLNSLQTQSSNNVRELSNAFNNQLSNPKPNVPGSALGNPFKTDATISGVSRKERDKDNLRNNVPSLLPSIKPKDDLAGMNKNAHSTYTSTAPSIPTSGVVGAPSTNQIASALGKGDFQILSGQLNNLLNISATLQKEMSNLSRRSKDNAMDLMSLKEATNNRDEDIRKSLKDLALGLNVPGRSASRLAITASDEDLDISGALTRYGSAPDIHRSFVSDAEEVLRQSHAKRKSIGKDIQATREIHSTDRIIKEMATKEGQRHILDIVSRIQSDVMMQSKVTTAKFSEVLRGLEPLATETPERSITRYGDQDNGTASDHGIIIDLLEVLKTSMEERMDDLQNSLSLINNGSARGSQVDHGEQFRSVSRALESFVQTTNDLKTAIYQVQLPTAEVGIGYQHISAGIQSQIMDISSKLDSIPPLADAILKTSEESVSSVELKDMLKTLIEMASRNEAGTHKAAEVLLQELSKISTTVSQPWREPTEFHEHSNPKANIGPPDISALQQMLADVQSGVNGQEKLTEKALEIMLREMAKIEPSLGPKIASLIPSADTIGHATRSALHPDLSELRSNFSSSNNDIRDSLATIQSQLHLIAENMSSQALVIRPDHGDSSGFKPQFDGSVAAVSAIGAMGKDLKHTMENLQSDINGHEKVTEKAMEIILREIASISKTVLNVPAKVVDGVQDAFKTSDEMKQALHELQADVLGREKHTEKALEIILRELQTVAANFDKAQLALAHSQEQKASVYGQTEKDIKFNLETILTRSSRVADTTATIQELLESYQTNLTESNITLNNSIGGIERTVKGPIENLQHIVATLQDQFKGSSSNTAESIIEVAKYLDTLGEKASTNAFQVGEISKSLGNVGESISGIDLVIKSIPTDIKSQLEEMVQTLESSNSRALEEIRRPAEEELAKEKKDSEKVVDELKTIVESLKEGFAQSVVTTEARNSELSKNLEQYCQSARQDQQQTQVDIQSVKDSVLGLQSDDGTLAKILLAMKDVAEYLAKTSAPENLAADKIAELQTSLAGLEVKIDDWASTSSEPKDENDKIDIQAKLETLLNHSNHQAKFFSQMSLLDDIKTQVQESSGHLSEFIAAQTTMLQTTAATERHEAAEATLMKEKALAERSAADATTAALKAEELNLQASVLSLKTENEDLIKRKQLLSTELSSLETALALRREELVLLEGRAELLEKRMVEGVINQSRSLLLSKSNGTANRPLRRIVNPPVSGTLRSNISGNNRRIASMNLLNTNTGGLIAPESQNRTPSGSSIFPTNANSIRRSHSVRTTTNTLRKTSWAALQPPIHDEVSEENKENEVALLENSTPGPDPMAEAVEELGWNSSESITPARSEQIPEDSPDGSEPAADIITPASTEAIEKPPSSVGNEVVRREKRYPSSLSAISGTPDATESEIE